MNILFSSDDNYARHLGVAINSLLSHNPDFPKFKIYVVDNNISSDNILKLNQVVAKFENAEMFFIPFKKWVDSLHLNMSWPISLSSYARLFVGEMLPVDADRLLYLDCDMLVNGDISELWNTDLGDNIIGAVQDQVYEKIKVAVGLNVNDPYFNAGMLLINLEKWRKDKLTSLAKNFIESHHGRVIHHDQGVLNGLLNKRWKRLPLKYNVMTIHYLLSQSRVRRFFHEHSSFYNDEEIADAMHNPVILHFTPSFTSRPWEKNCIHPLRNLYKAVLYDTPWADMPLEKDKNHWYVKLINWYYRNFDFV